LPCIDCHAANASTLPNGVAAPNKAYFLFTGHGQYAGSNQCTDCHDANSRHIAGSLGAYTRLTLVNDSTLCASCHNSTKVGATYRYMVTHVDKGLTCQECHDPHGTSNRSMIRAGIKGVAIGFYDAGNCVDLVTNRGLCQVCHTKTNHYRAGVTESGHYSSGCLGCHNHNSEGGAFKPIAGSGCDSCHGYPPAPKNLAGAFGTSSNWVGGRFEDYSGGGGAHLIAAHITPFAQPEEGWSNCTICHNGGRTLSQPYHRMILPVKENVANVRVEVDPKFRFSPRQMVYTGARQLNPPQENATGRCSNIACHMRPSKRWSGDR
jgi:predicted CXXCH cytochrome family protein